MIAKMPSETLKGFRWHFLLDIILNIFYRRVMLPSGETSSPFPLGKSLRFR